MPAIATLRKHSSFLWILPLSALGCLSLTLGADETPAAPSLEVPVSDADLGFSAETTVVFDGTDDKAFRNHGFQLADGMLSGSGQLATKKKYNNFHLKIRLRHSDECPMEFSLNKERVKIFRNKKEASAHVGKWLELEFLFRHLPGEAPNVRHLNQGFTHQGKKGRLFHDDNLYRLDQFPRDESGYILVANRGVMLEFRHQVDIARVEVTPLVANSPREILSLSGEEHTAFVAQGQQVYATYCVNCHGNGIDSAPNPLARSFAKEDLQNGSSQLEIYKTLTTGFRTMPPMTVLTVEQRHQVAAYLREAIIKEHRPDSYQTASPTEAESLPHPLYTLQEAHDRANKPATLIAKEKGYFRDHGPVIVNAYGDTARNAVHVRLPDQVAVSYDLHTLNLIDVRTDGYLDMLTSQEFQQRPSTGVLAAGEPHLALGGSSWIRDGLLQSVKQNRPGLSPDSGLAYHGHYIAEDQAALSYRVDGRDILESPSSQRAGEQLSLSQHLHISPGDQPLQLGLVPHPQPITDATASQLIELEIEGQKVTFQLRSDAIDSLQWVVVNKHLALQIAPSAEPISLTLTRSVGSAPSDIPTLDLQGLTKGSARNWPTTYTVRGKLSEDRSSAYVMDTIPVPFENEYEAWMRTSALAFFPDGRAAITTYGGDVWIVSGIDDDLESVTWSRHASGLFEAFGCEVIDDLIYVTTRNGIVRLHDRNDDGEADYYEQFFADPDISPNWHAYSFDLIRDTDGYLYYARNGQFTDSQLEGGAYKVSPDGKSHELYCSGFRTPNGMGILPDGRLTFGDNQGSYVPAGKLTIVEPGKWHGATNLQGAEGEQRDRVEPILWFPQEVDNSCGGQHFINDPRFGPYDQHLVHTSCGRAEAMVVYIDRHADGTTQAASQTFPFHFDSGAMRPRINPTDGQLYIVGTRGWQIRADYDGCLQRIRYTGQESPLLLDAVARKGGIELTFNLPIDAASLDGANFQAAQWNYLWAKTYGSKQYSVVDPAKEGKDELEITAIEHGKDRKRIWVSLPQLRPSHNLSLSYALETDTGVAFENSVNMTLHKLPAR